MSKFCDKCKHPWSWHAGLYGCDGVPGEMLLGQLGECGCILSEKLTEDKLKVIKPYIETKRG